MHVTDPALTDVSPPPVLLVPGAVGQEYVYWNFLERRLRRDGYTPHKVTFPRFTMADLRVSATLLGRRVEEILLETGASRVAIVAHSMGGLITRWYVRFLGGARHLDAVVLLATPHRGTVAGLTGLPFRGARQVVPGSPFLNTLNNGAATEGVPTTNVYSLTDLVVVPQLSARLPVKGAHNRQVTFAGHWGMLVSPRVYHHVHVGLGRGLHAAEPAPAKDAPVGV